MNNEIKSETEANMECFIHLVIGEVVCHETDVARQLKQGKSFAEHNKTVFDVAMAVAKFYKKQLDLRMDALVKKATVESELQRVIEERDKYRNFAIELGDNNSALKRQLDESNKQIEIYAKKVRNLEAELEEDGGLG